MKKRVEQLTYLFLLSFVFLFAVEAGGAEKVWWPVEVEATFRSGEVKKLNFVPPEKAKKPYSIGVLVPHFKDAYWIAVNYAITQEAKRLGVRTVMLDAGGYTNVSKQIDQFEDLVQKQVDGMILSAVNADALGKKVDEAWKKNRLPVVATVIHTNSENLISKAFYHYSQVGLKIAEYIQNRGGGKVIFFPGPPGAMWTEETFKGFKDYVEAHPGRIEILAVKYGETGKETQLQLVEDALQRFPIIDYIVGNAVSIAAAPIALERTGRAKQIKLVATYLAPELTNYMREGKLQAICVDHAAMFPRMSLGLLVRYLNGESIESIPAQVMTPIDVFDKEEWDKRFVWDLELAPEGYRPQFTVK